MGFKRWRLIGDEPKWCRWGTVLTVYWLFMFTATHIPLPAHGLPRHSDKTAHVCGYAVLAVLFTFWRCWHRAAWDWRSGLGCLATLMVYAVLDEALQYPVGRTPDVMDAVADCLGAVLGIGLGGLVCYNRLARSPDHRG